jgi:hypothetical protein
MNELIIEQVFQEYQELERAKELLNELSHEVWMIDRGMKKSFSRDLIHRLNDFYGIDENE